MNTSLIDMRDIGKTYGGRDVETRALNGIDLRIEKGEFVSFTGPSGCGKSTLLSLIGLLASFTSGRYRFDGLDTAVLDRDARARIRNRRIGFIFQSFNLLSGLTAAENVALPLHRRGNLGPAEIEARVETALEKVGMSHRRRYLPSQLSGGQQQRVAVARALAGRPALVLADEPTGNLDSKNAKKVTALLASLNAEGAAVCLVTHDAGLAAQAPRTVELLDGRMVADQVNRG
ncbi:MAG: ABC transporter ATP-binding protein [Acidobacteriota bacterium]|nr:ABC transporter ATP-binding protein [Acidobacteriota bacterium]